MGDSDSGDDYEEDERIVKLVEKIGKEEPAEEVVRYMKEELGGKNGMVYGGMCFNENVVMSHFLIMSVFDEDSTLTSQIEEQKDLLKTFVDGDEEVMYAFLVAMELYICKELRKGISKFDKVMKKLWESDIISEDVADRWHGNEQALHEFYPEFQLEDAIAIRESGLKFVEWVREGGD